MDKYYLAALNSAFTYLPAATLWELIARFGSAQKVFSADFAALKDTKLVSAQLLNRYKSRYRPNLPDDIANYCHIHSVQLVDFREQLYPAPLRHIFNPPPVLYIKGQFPEAQCFLAMVGSRKATAYGLSAAKRMAAETANKGIVIVSGGAYGIDTASHKGALEGGGITVAVIGSGFDNIYPAGNHRLFSQIQEKGAVITEFSPDTEPLGIHFPLRNRIIAGISSAVLVVEAAIKSGAVITARLAMEEGRDVFAIPGDITSPTSMGTNSLIQDGAKLISCSEDILAEYHLLPQKEKKAKVKNISLFDILPKKEVKDAEKVLAAISYHRSVTIDELVLYSGLPVQKLAGLLLNLQLKGLIGQDTGNRYICN
jgi:DNA processing protein